MDSIDLARMGFIPSCRWIRIIILYLGLSCTYGLTLRNQSTPPGIKTLASEILSDYKVQGTYGRPVLNPAVHIRINISVHLMQILNLDEQNQILTSTMESSYKWYDEYIQWDPDDYGGARSVRLPLKEIWTPDIIIANSVAEEEPLDRLEELLHVQWDGTVTWKQRKLRQTSCITEMDTYPFDRQRCQVLLTSDSYSKHEIDLVPVYDEGVNLLNLKSSGGNTTQTYVLGEYIQASEWLVEEIRMFSDGSERTTLNKMTFTLVISRKIVFFTYILMLPCLILTGLTLLIFWLPPERPDKTSLAMSIFASFMVLLLVLVGTMPSTASSIPILGLFYFFNMGMAAMSIVLAVLVVNLSRSSKSKPPVPPWLKSIAIDTLAGIFGAHFTSSKVLDRYKEKMIQRLQAKQEAERAAADSNAAQNTLEKNTTGPSSIAIDDKSVPSSPLDDIEKCEIEHDLELQTKALEEFADQYRTESTGDGRPVSGYSLAGDLRPVGDHTINVKNNELLQAIKEMGSAVKDTNESLTKIYDNMQEKDRKAEYKDEKAYEWYTVAVAFDRLFFFLYFSTVLIFAFVSSAILFNVLEF